VRLALILRVLALATAFALGLIKLPPSVGLPSPGPTSQPRDTASAANRFVNTDPPSPLSIGKGPTVTGQGLQAGRPAAAGFIQGDTHVHPISELGLTVSQDGSFTGSGVVPPELEAGVATLVACNFDASGQPITASCIQRAVTLR